jgi:hypothetical protein
MLPVVNKPLDDEASCSTPRWPCYHCQEPSARLPYLLPLPATAIHRNAADKLLGAKPPSGAVVPSLLASARACSSRHRLAFPSRTRSHLDLVRWHAFFRHVIAS